MDGFASAGRSPMIMSGGIKVPDLVKERQPSIFRSKEDKWAPRVNLPKENPKYPETKHTVKCARAEPVRRKPRAARAARRTTSRALVGAVLFSLSRPWWPSHKRLHQLFAALLLTCLLFARLRIVVVSGASQEGRAQHHLLLRDRSSRHRELRPGAPRRQERAWPIALHTHARAHAHARARQETVMGRATR